MRAGGHPCPDGGRAPPGTAQSSHAAGTRWFGSLFHLVALRVSCLFPGFVGHEPAVQWGLSHGPQRSGPKEQDVGWLPGVLRLVARAGLAKRPPSRCHVASTPGAGGHGHHGMRIHRAAWVGGKWGSGWRRVCRVTRSALALAGLPLDNVHCVVRS